MKYKGLLRSGKVLLEKQKKRLFYHITLLLSKFGLSNPLPFLLQIVYFNMCRCLIILQNTLNILFTIFILFNITQYLYENINPIENCLKWPCQNVLVDSDSFVTPINYKNDITFYEFKHKYNKKYTTNQQEIFRSIVFYRNLIKINTHNKNQNKTFTMRVNQFADLTPQQFASIYTTLYKSDKQIKNIAQQIVSPKKSSNLLQFDNNYSISQYAEQYAISEVKRQLSLKHENLLKDNPQFVQLNKILSNRKKQFLVQRFNKHKVLKQSISTQSLPIISPATNDTQSQIDGNYTVNITDWTMHSGQIRYQGICGACYTFATSDSVASLYSIYKFGFFIPLSTQQVIDCSTNGLTYGCNGGFLQGSYVYMQIRGIQPDSVYPYTSSIDDTSKECKSTGGPFKVASFRNIDERDCKDLVNELNYGPVSIGIAGYRLQFYSEGIFNDCNSYIDHAVVLIGYKSGIGWKIKNSWGVEWGMQGYAWIKDGNNCGICNMAVSAKIQ